MPKSFDDFNSARIAIDATEIIQDVPSDMNCQAFPTAIIKVDIQLKQLLV